jgi:hypothetical protein
MQARVCDTVKPMTQLLVEIRQIAKATREKEVLANIAERPLDFAFGLGPIRPTGSWMEAVMTRDIDQRPIVDNAFVTALADHRGLHAVVEDLTRHAAQRLERRHVAAQDRREVLVHDEARPDQPTET